MDNFTRIKQTLSLVNVVEEDVNLKRNGKVLKACCPFHDERTPSFTVYPDSQDFHCFGCQAHGTVIDYIMYRLGTKSASDALLYISTHYGIHLDDVDMESIKQRKEIIGQKKEYAATLYKQGKQQSPVEYMKSRGFNSDTMHTFGIGYEPKRKAIAIPFLNAHGEVVGNTLRLLEGDGPKYVNDSEDEVFQKSNLLYGLDKARKTADKQLYIVEGYMDVMSIHQMGFPSVAYCSASLTDGQVDLLRNYIRPYTKIYLIPDNDKAGRQAAVKNLEKLRGRLKNRISVIELPEEIKDANDLLVAGKNISEIEPTPLELYLLKQELDKCLEITDEYEVSFQFGQRVRNEMMKQTLAKYLSQRWGESLEQVSKHMNTSAPTTAEKSNMVSFTEAFVKYTKEVVEGDGRIVRYQYNELDELVPKGMRKAELIYVLGRSGSGKTTFANNVKYNAFYHQKKNVLDFSLELSDTAMIPQFLQKHMRWTEKQIERLVRGEADYTEEIANLQTVMDERYRIIDTPVSLEDIRENIRIANEEIFASPVDLVVIDYFGMIRLPGKDSPYNERSDLARGLKEVAKEFNCSIMCLVQANRDGGADGSSPLSLQSARDTGAIEESADYVLGIYRPGISPELDKEERVLVEKEMRVQVLKARWGRLGEVLLRFEGAKKLIENWPSDMPSSRRN